MTVRFFIPESDDRVDPEYDFEKDSYSAKRASGIEHDVYAHELFGSSQCDGLLITRSQINERRKELIVSLGGVHGFLRLEKGVPIIADCGAFQYRDEENPPYSCEDTCDFYDALGFDYGISLDHMILDFNLEYDESTSLLSKAPSADMQRRFRLTIDNAKEMHQLCAKKKYRFKLIGSVQGWSPESYLLGVQKLLDAGLRYLALGGLARASDEQLRSVLDAVRATVVEHDARLHILGVARLSLLPDYVACNVASCDSASTILQAFKSNKDNYHTREKKYTAVRIPPATGDLSPKVRKLLKRVEVGEGDRASEKLHKRLIKLEQWALAGIRAYAAHELPLKKAMKALIAYEDEFGDEKRYYPFFEETLKDRPWESCPCVICQDIGIEVIILRGNNRNRRRGFHNTYVFYEQFKKLRRKLGARKIVSA